MNDYTAAPATELVATHCCACGRPLLDAPSVERGIGPTCAEKYGYDRAEGAADWTRATAAMGAAGLDASALAAWGADARAAVNALVHRIAATPDDEHTAARVAAVAALGYGRLAERLTARLAEGRAVVVRREGDSYTVAAPYSEAFGAALRAHAPARRWDREARVWRVPVRARAGLWAALREAFAGAPLVTDAGVTVVRAA